MVNLKLTAKLTTDGTPLPNKAINFYRSTDNVNWSSIGSATTDANGVAEITYNETSTTTVYYKARFDGDADYEASEAAVQYTLTSPSPTTIPIEVIMLIIIPFIMIVLISILIAVVR